MTIELQQFCSTEKYRIKIQEPFSRGEFTYATNGHIAIRVPRLSDIPEREGAPTIETIFTQYFDDRAKGALKVALPLMDAKKVDCRSCDGRGTEHDCPDCGCECEDCDGDGKVEQEDKVCVKVGDGLYRGKYIGQLLGLPGLKFPVAPDKENAAPFLFDGGDGLLMPMRYADSDPIKATVEI